jgi:hypothetical protein
VKNSIESKKIKIKITKLNLQLNKYWKTKLKKNKFKKEKKKANVGKPSKSGLMYKTHNSLNFRLELNQETQFPANIMLKY